MKWIQENFGEEALEHAIVLFTNGDELEYNEMTINEYINSGGKLKKLVDKCNNRFHVFKNRDKDQKQVTELLTEIKTMINKNEKLYTKEKYEETQKNLNKIFGGIVGAGGGTAVMAGAGNVIITTATAAVVGGAAAVVGSGLVGAGLYAASKKFTSNKNKGD